MELWLCFFPQINALENETSQSVTQRQRPGSGCGRDRYLVVSAAAETQQKRSRSGDYQPRCCGVASTSIIEGGAKYQVGVSGETLKKLASVSHPSSWAPEFSPWAPASKRLP